MSEFSQLLLNWYNQNRRSLPWRGTADPYRIWLSEIMLQQTRTETVQRYYQRFLEQFPTVQALADADQDVVLKLWEGLGYYSRARNLHAAAKMVAHTLNGRFPSNAAELRTLPGVGPYAANAIASIAYDEPVPALDGNQARVLSRALAWDVPLKTPFDLETPALAWMDDARPGDYNQALMDLGASVCTPRAPDCRSCPVAALCAAAQEGDPEAFPRKKPPVPKQELDLTICVVMHKDAVVVRKRPERGLLGGLYEFPAAEGRLNGKDALSALESMGFCGVQQIRPLPPSKHVFTHLVWHMSGWLLSASDVPAGWQLAADLSTIAFPSALRIYREIAGELLDSHRDE